MEYIRIEDGIIAAHVCGDRPGDDWIEIAGEFWGAVGEPVAWYDENLNRLDDITLYETGRRPLPEGMRLNDGHTGLVEMDEDEKVIAGLKPVPFGMRVDGGRLVSKTEREMWLDGDISTEEYAARKRRERDGRLSSTDKYLLPDFPISDGYREEICRYRQLLRDITADPSWPDVEIPPVPTGA